MASYVLDRFEGTDWAVLEDSGGRTFNIPKAWLPESVREGDVLRVDTQLGADIHGLRIRIDEHVREERLSNAGMRRDRLPKGPKGDISL